MIIVMIDLKIATIILILIIMIIKTEHRKRKVIWFNLPFCKTSNIDIGKYFLKLKDRHFNKDSPLNRIFNRNTLKISHSLHE